MTLVLALNYSAKWEILEAARQMAALVKDGKMELDDINETSFANALSTRGIPDPELLIRTSGENRLSNFLLWQLAYAEFYFTDVLWPDFNGTALDAALEDYAQRQRRFGRTSAQVEAHHA